MLRVLGDCRVQDARAWLSSVVIWAAGCYLLGFTLLEYISCRAENLRASVGRGGTWAFLAAMFYCKVSHRERPWRTVTCQHRWVSGGC